MYRNKGFTLIELMVTVAVVAILASIALPSYTQYIVRSRIPPGLDALSSARLLLESRYQDLNNYGTGTTCGVTLPAADNFTVTCALTNSGQSFRVTATGSGSLTGYAYSVDHLGVRRTDAHPKGVPSQNCWSLRGNTCDS